MTERLEDLPDLRAEIRDRVKRHQAQPPAVVLASTDDAPQPDPTFRYRRSLANLADATMIRVVELEEEAKRLTEIAKKLRAAVVANT